MIAVIAAARFGVVVVVIADVEMEVEEAGAKLSMVVPVVNGMET
ncbi:MAG: hypothetical protein PVG92_04880 [Holophagae bacterium]